MAALRFLLYCLLLPGLLSAQTRPDQVWLLGTQDAPGFSGYGNAIMRFQNGVVDLSQADLHMNFESTMAVMPDTAGNILFYTNGCHIANAWGDTMPNGAGLNPGEIHDWACPSSGYISPLGAMILPLPGSMHLYYIFHMGVRYDPEKKLSFGPFYYSIVDMSLDGGKGVVVSKNNVLADGNFEPFAAVRHGNGRDWWLVFPEYGHNRYHRFLFSPSGPENAGEQQIGASLSCRYIGSSAFSPNGSRYARQQHCGVVAMDFDRCSGLFSNDHFINLPPNAFGGGGVAFNKDGSRLFVSTQLSVQEANMNSVSPELDTVVGWLDVVGSSLHLMQYTPDGRIFLSNLGRGRFYHTIEHPEDLAIGFQQRGVSLPVFNVRTLPNYPNHRLYDLPGSLCDTLNINSPSAAGEPLQAPLRVFPNPASAETLLRSPWPLGGKWSLACSSGNIVRSGEWRGDTLLLQVASLPPGLYVFRLQASDGQVYFEKIAVQR